MLHDIRPSREIRIKDFSQDGLRALLFQEINHFLLVKHDDDPRSVPRTMEIYHNGEGAQVGEIELTTARRDRGELYFVVYDDPPLLDETRALPLISAGRQVHEFIQHNEHGRDRWARQYMLEMASFLENHFKMRLTKIHLPEVVGKDTDTFHEVTEFFGVIPVDIGIDIEIGIERWRYIPRKITTTKAKRK